MSSVTIRRATNGDLDAVARVEHAADARFADVGLDVVLQAPQAEADDHAPAQSAGRLFVATGEHGDVVGFVRIDLVDDEPHIEQLSVHPDAGGRGIGAQLMRVAEQWSGERGYRRLTLCTYRDVPWNGPYYERLGWVALPDDECGPELRGLRDHERALGLEVQPRQAMVKELESRAG